MSILKIELASLALLDPAFDFTLTGFEIPEIDLILKEDVQNEESEFIPEQKGPAVTKPGDIWQLGKHLILCGNALERSSYEILMQEELAQVVFTDPPYNVPSNRIGGKGRARHEDFVMGFGEMSSQDFTEFLSKTFSHLKDFSSPGSLHYICMDWRHMMELLDAGKSYAELKNLCVWNKTNGGMGSFYRSKHELVFVFKNGKEAHINNIDLGKHGRYRTNVWDYAGVNVFAEGRMSELSMHPTVKPVALIQDALLDCTKRNGIVLDCFAGSGSALIAAERVNRRARLIELDPQYVDVTLLRYKNETGEEPILVRTSQTFDQAKEARNG